MGVKNLILGDKLTSFAERKEQGKTDVKTRFCGVCFLPNENLPVIKNVNDFVITGVKNFLHKIILSYTQKHFRVLLDNLSVLLRESSGLVKSCAHSELKKIEHYYNGIVSVFSLFAADLQHCWIDLVIKGFYSFIPCYIRPFWKEYFSSQEGFFVLFELQKFLKLNESVRRDMARYVPDILCV
jgi:hypothetical protein